MATSTLNYGFVKPDGEDTFDVDVYISNLDAIESAIDTVWHKVLDGLDVSVDWQPFWNALPEDTRDTYDDCVFTEKLHLCKPDRNVRFDYNIYNYNLDVISAALYEMQNNVTGSDASVVKAQSVLLKPSKSGMIAASRPKPNAVRRTTLLWRMSPQVSDSQDSISTLSLKSPR